MKRLFPNGFGTRTVIAWAVVGSFCTHAILAGDGDGLKELALMVVTFFFTVKAMTPSANGGGS